MKTASFLAATVLGLLLAAVPAAAEAGINAEHATQSSLAAAHPAPSDPSTRHDGGMSRQDFEAFRLKKLQEIATYFGIKTEGKTAAQLKKEVEAAKTADKQKWEAFKAEHKAERMEHLRRIAEKHGIKTEGKTFEQLREELHQLHQGGKREQNPQQNNNKA
jgi:hypothetical protein